MFIVRREKREIVQEMSIQKFIDPTWPPIHPLLPIILYIICHFNTQHIFWKILDYRT